MTRFLPHLSVALLAGLSLSCLEPVETKIPGSLDEACELTAQCAAGLSCLDPDDYFAARNDDGCVSATLGQPAFCSIACASDSDCAEAGGWCRRFGCDAGQRGLCSRSLPNQNPALGDGGLLPPPAALDAGSPVESPDAG